MSRNKIGNKTDLSNQFKWQRKISAGYYTQLIETRDSVFELYRNQEYISKIINVTISETAPVIDRNNFKQKEEPGENYAVFSLGGRAKYKIWNTSNFIRVAEHVKTRYNLKIVLLGLKHDLDLSLRFEKEFNPADVYNFTAKTNLVDVIQILKGAELMITNDSGPAHIAAALGTKTIVLANGTHLGRFFPYPDSVNSVKAIFPPSIEAELQKSSTVFEKYKYRSTLDINSISCESVIRQADVFLKK